ncbi:MAG: transposase [Gammaproteobacteria bacterium RIFOXYA12_FULL_61_12]|nr:MAG: transposase [Gammaproteobacteria bacterium RIFOXYD12_FULL_61_37]OGT92986.1 MAG: transposase [Gammaproteobacteria bacterium RIFOXYA12_FULL_61_12]
MPYDSLRIGRFSEANRAYFVTTVLAERDRRYFTDLWLARIMVAEMRRLHDAGVVHSLAWVVMPDHLHWLFQIGEAATLAQVVKNLKARSAHRINQRLNRQGPLWQKAYYDHALRRDEDVRQIARYICANPLRAGLVRMVGDYSHWDAIWL